MFKGLLKRLIGHQTKRFKCPCCGEPTNVLRDGLCKECWERIYGGVWEQLKSVENVRASWAFEEGVEVPEDGFVRIDIEVKEPCVAVVSAEQEGGVTRRIMLNEGRPLEAGCEYKHWMPARRGERLNVFFTRETVASVTISWLKGDAIGVSVRDLGAEARAALTLFAFEVDEVLKDETLTAEEKVEKLKTLVKSWVKENMLDLSRVEKFSSWEELEERLIGHTGGTQP